MVYHENIVKASHKTKLWSGKDIQCGDIVDIGSPFSNGEQKAVWAIRFQKEAEFTCVETL